MAPIYPGTQRNALMRTLFAAKKTNPLLTKKIKKINYISIQKHNPLIRKTDRCRIKQKASSAETRNSSFAY